MRGTLVGLVAGVVLGAGAYALGRLGVAEAGEPPGVVRASKFVVVDAAGRGRAELSTQADPDAVQLVLRDKAGALRLVLAVGPTGEPVLTLLDRHGAPRVSAAVDSEGTSTFAVLGRTMDQRVDLRAATDGTLSLACFAREDRPGIVLLLGADGRPALRLLDSEGRVLAAFPPDGGPAPGPAPVAPLPPSARGGVRDGVSGADLGTDPLDRMEDPTRSARPHEKLPGTARTNAALLFVRWSEAYVDAVQARASWRGLVDTGQMDQLPVREAVAEALATYLAAAARAEVVRGEYHRAVGKTR